MNRWITTHKGEGAMQPQVIRVALGEGEEGSTGPRYVAQQDRDERAFLRAWARLSADEREFQRALRNARVTFLVRMAVLS